MEVRYKKCKSGNIWRFVNEGWSTSRAWGHKTTVFKNDYQYEPNKVTYINRTWECYIYQTCMSGAVWQIHSDELNKFIENYKEKNDIARFKRGQKEEVIKMFDATVMGQDLQELKDAINLREFSHITVE